MAKLKLPATAATRVLKQAQIPFTAHSYNYEDRGGTAVSARELGIDEHRIIKTLIMEDSDGNPLTVLMHGDREVSTKTLARLLGVKNIEPCSPEIANKHSGYMVGGTSPFGTRKPMPVYMERSICDLDRMFVNGGKRGFLVGIAPQDVIQLLRATLVEVGITKERPL